ncbi:MAG: hypothetical protein LBQ63_03390 [Deltaproteobacteria bacterium]|jgi:hypothetical protein|nr:hypothetical protein [Deltaproteobacteria bacterium]
MDSWQEAFTKGKISWRDKVNLKDRLLVRELSEFKHFLDLVHIRHCLLKPYFENSDYPLVESRELLPSFDADMFEHKNLPGFSLVAFGRPINYFSEVFQFDFLQPITSEMSEEEAIAAMTENMQTFQNRIHKTEHPALLDIFSKLDLTSLDNYSALMPFLMQMDRAQVLAMNGDVPEKNNFCLCGIYASFPSDLDTEIKRYGLRIGKFSVGNNEMYENNRLFVYQYLMELYGFPIASERRTSAALFSRRLHKMGEKFLIRTLGQSDRTITTVWTDSPGRPYPKVEKISLIALDKDQTEYIDVLQRENFFVDAEKRVVLIRIKYKQHAYSANNVREDRALSVDTQEIIHPISGESMPGVNLIKDSTNMFLRLNDIVRGEYSGSIVYKRTELIENTDTDEKKLKFLYAWLSKHQHRLIAYSDEFFLNVSKVLDTYLFSAENYLTFNSLDGLYQEVFSKYSYIQQARKIKLLEDLKGRYFRGKRIGYGDMLEEVIDILQSLKFDVVNYFAPLVDSIINISDSILNDRYLRRNYIDRKGSDLSARQQSIRRNYGKLVSLVDEFKAIRRMRAEIVKHYNTVTQQAKT